MKKKIMPFVVSLLLSTGAFAVDSGKNSVFIDQTNADNSSISITQTGYGNSVGDLTNLVVPQFKIDGNNMDMTVTQNGMNNIITGNFIGGASTATVSQIGSGNSLVLNQGNFGTAAGTMNLSFTGDNNATTFNMATLHDTSSYQYTLTVGGNQNNITSTMNSKYIQNSIAITGNGNTYTTTQTGVNGTPLVVGHNITSTIIGNNNTTSITQNGTTTPNTVTLNVTGNNTATTIIQH